MEAEWEAVREPPTTAVTASDGTTSAIPDEADAAATTKPKGASDVTRIITKLDAEKRAKETAAAAKASGSASLVLYAPSTAAAGGAAATAGGAAGALVIARRVGPPVPKPTWHAPWKLQSVVSGHLGWVRAIAFDAGNEWFVTGSADRTIKVCVAVRTWLEVCCNVANCQLPQQLCVVGVSDVGLRCACMYQNCTRHAKNTELLSSKTAIACACSLSSDANNMRTAISLKNHTVQSGAPAVPIADVSCIYSSGS